MHNSHQNPRVRIRQSLRYPQSLSYNNYINIKITLFYTTLQTDQNHELCFKVYDNDENEISVKREISVLSKVVKKMLTRLSL